MKKIMFYCQYLTGMGHLVRSSEIVRQLVKNFQVCFVNGGPTVPNFEIDSQAKIVTLPPLWIEKGEFKVSDDFTDIETVKNLRKQTLIDLVDKFQPDCLITEFFPFGRHKLLFELLPLLDHIKAVYPQTKIVCSVRDIVGRSNLAEEEETICHLTRQYFDLILFHSDAQFQTLEESFLRVDKLDCAVKYTGFVAQPFNQFERIKTQDFINIKGSQPMILVSIGGGRIGYQLLETVIQSSSLLKELIPHKIQIFTGPFMQEEQFLQLQTMAKNHDNVKLQRYTNHLMMYMQKADLSISLTGYNTTMNILQTGVRSLVVPIGHYGKDEEQLLRTKKLEKLGIVQMLQDEELNPNSLAQKIIHCLQSPPQKNRMSFELKGAEKTSMILQKFLSPSVSLVA
jgi:predicted glycosyltransferase